MSSGHAGVLLRSTATQRRGGREASCRRLLRNHRAALRLFFRIATFAMLCNTLRMASHLPHNNTPVVRIGVGEAVRITGYHADTIRRAADAGKIDEIRTPGGHRRLALADVVALANGSHTSPEDAASEPGAHSLETSGAPGDGE